MTKNYKWLILQKEGKDFDYDEDKHLWSVILDKRSNKFLSKILIRSAEEELKLEIYLKL